jgi:hypothetical protein
MILLENPKVVEEHYRLQSLPKRLPESSTSLKKSNSFFNLSGSRELFKENLVPPIDWTKKRTSSLSKTNAGSSSASPVKQPIVNSNPFKNMGSFLEKAIDAFRLEDDDLLGRPSTASPEVPQDTRSLLDTFTVHIGTQQKRTMYNMLLCVKDVSDHFKLSEEEKSIDAFQQSLYSNSLSSLIVIVRKDELPSYGRNHANSGDL